MPGYECHSAFPRIYAAAEKRSNLKLTFGLMWILSKKLEKLVEKHGAFRGDKESNGKRG